MPLGAFWGQQIETQNEGRLSAARVSGGEIGIRTPVRLTPKPDFESGAFDHSAISPGIAILAGPREA